jgi:protoheme ferro-lyase
MENKHITYKSRPIRLIPDFSFMTQKASRDRIDALKTLRDHRYQPTLHDYYNQKHFLSSYMEKIRHSMINQI